MRRPRAPAIDRPSAPAPSLALTSAMVLSRLVTAEQRPPDRLISRRFPARSKAFHELRPPEAPPTHARDGGGGVDDEGALLLPPLVRPQCGLQRLQQGGPTPRDLAARTLEPTPSAPQVLLIHLALPWTVSALQLGLGLMYIVPLWLTGLRTPPNLSIADVKGMVPVSLIHAAGQAVTVASIGAPPALLAAFPTDGGMGPSFRPQARALSPSSTSSSRSSLSSTWCSAHSSSRRTRHPSPRVHDRVVSGSRPPEADI